MLTLPVLQVLLQPREPRLHFESVGTPELVLAATAKPHGELAPFAARAAQMCHLSQPDRAYLIGVRDGIGIRFGWAKACGQCTSPRPEM